MLAAPDVQVVTVKCFTCTAGPIFRIKLPAGLAQAGSWQLRVKECTTNNRRQREILALVSPDRDESKNGASGVFVRSADIYHSGNSWLTSWTAARR